MKKKILIVEDESLIRRDIVISLKSQYPEVEIHESSELEGVVEKVTSIDFDVLLLDGDLKGKKSSPILQLLTQAQMKKTIIIGSDEIFLKEVEKFEINLFFKKGLDDMNFLVETVGSVLSLEFQCAE